MEKESVLRILQSNIDLLMRKSKDYGNNNLFDTGIEGMAVRLTDKIARLRNLSKNHEDPNFESIYDTLQDITNYGIIGQMMHEGMLERSTSMVYLAGPIDAIDKTIANGWRASVASQLAEKGIASFNPYAAYTIPKNFDSCAKHVTNINYNAVLECGTLLAVIPKGIATIGTIREIEFAVRSGITVIVVCGDDHKFLSLHDVTVFKTIKEAVNFITGEGTECTTTETKPVRKK